MKINYLTLTCMMGIGLGGNFAVAQDAVKEKPATSEAPVKENINDADAMLESEYGKIQGVVTKAGNDFMQKLRAEKDRNKQREMFRTMRPDHTVHMDQIMKLANAHPASDKTLKILIWGQGMFKPEQRAAAIKILIDNHIHKDQFTSVVHGLSRSGNEPNATFEKIKAASNNPKVRQAATFVIAQRCLNAKETKDEGIAMLKQLLAVPDISKTNPRLAKSAKQKIFVAENLSIGSVAPDIVGVDHADVEFKLSDYRGKVVLLDFWGHW